MQASIFIKIVHLQPCACAFGSRLFYCLLKKFLPSKQKICITSQKFLANTLCESTGVAKCRLWNIVYRNNYIKRQWNSLIVEDFFCKFLLYIAKFWWSILKIPAPPPIVWIRMINEYVKCNGECVIWIAIFLLCARVAAGTFNPFYLYGSLYGLWIYNFIRLLWAAWYWFCNFCYLIDLINNLMISKLEKLLKNLFFWRFSKISK